MKLSIREPLRTRRRISGWTITRAQASPLGLEDTSSLRWDEIIPCTCLIPLGWGTRRVGKTGDFLIFGHDDALALPTDRAPMPPGTNAPSATPVVRVGN